MGQAQGGFGKVQQWGGNEVADPLQYTYLGPYVGRPTKWLYIFLSIVELLHLYYMKKFTYQFLNYSGHHYNKKLFKWLWQTAAARNAWVVARYQ